MTEKQFLLAYDRKRTSTLTLDSEPGAHTGTTRQLIPGYSDSNIVFLNTSTGNDANTGASIAQAFLTYSAAATAAGTTKKIRLVNSATLTSNITKPTEATIGTTSTITSATPSAAVNVFTQAGTPSFGGTEIQCVAWVPRLKLFVAGGASGKIAYSADGNTWTQAASTGFSTNSVLSIAYSDKLKIAVAVGAAGKVTYSSDLITWQAASLNAIPSTNINSVIWSTVLSKFVAVTANADYTRSIFLSADGDEWATIANSSFGDSQIVSVCESVELGLLVAVGDSGKIAYSSDAITWTQAGTPSFGSTAVYAVAWSGALGRFVAAGVTDKIAYSTDGNTWTQAGTPSFGGSNIYHVSYCGELSAFVACGASGKIAYSTDGNTWTQAGTPSFGADFVFGAVYSPFVGKMVLVGDVGKIAYSTAFTTTISAAVAGFSIQAVQYSGTITAYNCTMKQPGTTANLSLNACRVTEAGSHISSNTAGSFATLFEGDRYTTCTPATQNAIDCNLDTVGGKWYIYNASATGFERVRDCLVTGGMVANFNVTVSGRANIQGDSENILIDAEVTTDDPKFVDTTDYKLQFQTNGYARNSLAAGRSAIYFNSAGSPRDIGAWSYVKSAVSYYFAKSVVLYKGEITHEIEEAVSEQQGDSGVVSVYGNTNRIKEILTITYGSTKEEDRAFLDYMRSLKDKGVKLIIDAEWESNSGTVTVNGNQSAGVEFLTVDSTTYFNGLWVPVSGKRYWIMRASPSNSAATKLILDRPLEDAVTDNQVLVTNYPPGVGEYQFSPQSRLTLRRAAPDGLTGWQSGLVLRFVRKYQ